MMVHWVHPMSKYSYRSGGQVISPCLSMGEYPRNPSHRCEDILKLYPAQITGTER